MLTRIAMPEREDTPFALLVIVPTTKRVRSFVEKHMSCTVPRSCVILRSICGACGGEVEQREGTTRLIHLGKSCSRSAHV